MATQSYHELTFRPTYSFIVNDFLFCDLCYEVWQFLRQKAFSTDNFPMYMSVYWPV